ncbi:Hypothetical protein D9617_14g075950 [Elsinoe fawcettii]|nr:Hypothetical protein D9617_14g075950 [Elsinoe fawcettii]
MASTATEEGARGFGPGQRSLIERVGYYFAFGALVTLLLPKYMAKMWGCDDSISNLLEVLNILHEAAGHLGTLRDSLRQHLPFTPFGWTPVRLREEVASIRVRLQEIAGLYLPLRYPIWPLLGGSLRRRTKSVYRIVKIQMLCLAATLTRAETLVANTMLVAITMPSILGHVHGTPPGSVQQLRDIRTTLHSVETAISTIDIRVGRNEDSLERIERGDDRNTMRMANIYALLRGLYGRFTTSFEDTNAPLETDSEDANSVDAGDHIRYDSSNSSRTMNGSFFPPESSLGGIHRTDVDDSIVQTDTQQSRPSNSSLDIAAGRDRPDETESTSSSHAPPSSTTFADEEGHLTTDAMSGHHASEPSKPSNYSFDDLDGIGDQFLEGN